MKNLDQLDEYIVEGTIIFPSTKIYEGIWKDSREE